MVFTRTAADGTKLNNGDGEFYKNDKANISRTELRNLLAKNKIKLKDGWDAGKLYDEVLSKPKGQRPPPSDYLPAEYVAAHLGKFSGGASYLVPKSILDEYGRDLLGWPDNSQFIIPKDQMDAVLAKANGNMAIVEKELGIPEGDWQKGEMVRINISDPGAHNLRMPWGRELGANDDWFPGGFLPTGKHEAIINQIPKGSYQEIKLWH